MSAPAVLRLYGPEECEAWLAGMVRGPRPLDWERCGTCFGGTVTAELHGKAHPCPTCGGYGSLKAAALAELRGRTSGLWVRGDPRPPVRCEGCGHPMSDGTWEGKAVDRDAAWPTTPELHPVTFGECETYERQGLAVYWSPCDEGCRHGGPGRLRDSGEWLTVPDHVNATPWQADVVPFGGEASWRQVDVRTLGWAFDLRPESLSVLCTRCWADRGSEA